MAKKPDKKFVGKAPQSANPKSTRPRAIRAIDNETRAVTLRNEGKTLAEIAEALGISIEGARKAILRAMADLKDEELINRVRALLLSDLDTVKENSMAMIMGGGAASEVAFNRFMRCVKMMAQISGIELSQVKQLEGSATGGNSLQLVYYTPGRESDDEREKHLDPRSAFMQTQQAQEVTR